MSPPPTVLIIGCGIAGPVLAVLLQRRGYRPIVFEKVRTLGDAGASLMLMPNGLKVLALADPSLVGSLYAAGPDGGGGLPLATFEDRSAAGARLGGSALPGTTFARAYGQRAVGVKRTALNLALKRLAEGAGIEVREGWALDALEEDPDGVTARFANGQAVRGAFLVGCDGLHATSRAALLRLRGGEPQPAPAYTGLTQTSGFSPAPAAFRQQEPGQAAMRNWFGEGMHVIAYPISQTHVSWAVTLPEPEDAARESWRLYSDDDPQQQQQREEVQRALLARLEQGGFEPAVLDIVRTAERLLKFGLFDRQALEAAQWHSARCVLAGDAAHPTSPHLGQGANQALEDCYHLSEALPDLSSSDGSGGGDGGSQEEGGSNRLGNLESIFAAYAQKRQPRTAALVRGARAAGEKRVVTTGSRDCELRNQKVAAEWADEDAVAAKYDNLCREPFNTAT